MLIDTHAHLDFQQFHRRHDEVIKRAQEAGVETIINVGSNLQGSKDSVDLAQKYPSIYASVGIHPDDVISVNSATMAELLKLAQEKKVVAIGEIGLDYSQKPLNKELQKKYLVIQIGLAKRLHLPIIIHNRDADEDILEILKVQASDVPGVIHCFTGNWELAKKFLKLGFLISFTGIITFKSKDDLKKEKRGCTEDKGIKEVIEKIPLEMVMVETDCPFLTPEPYRGKINEPAYVVEIAKKIAEIKKIPFGKVADITTQNAKNLFNLS